MYGELLIWQDVNQDGISQHNELSLLDQVGIASISLNASMPEDLYIEGSWISHVSTYVTESGAVREVVDAWFNYDSGTAPDYIEARSGEADSLIFLAIQESAIEIRNFDLEQDSLDLSTLIEGQSDITEAIDDFVYATEEDGATVISVDVDGAGGSAEMQQVARLDGVTGVSLGDLFNNGNIDI